MIKEQGFIAANYRGSDKIPMVLPSDITVAAAAELEKTSRTRNVRYVVSDEHTADEAAHILGAAIDKPDLKWVTISDERMQSGLETAGMPACTATLIVDMYASLRSGALAEDYDQHKPEAMGEVKLEDFAKGFVAAFNRA